MIGFKKLSDEAIMPSRAYGQAAGVDLRSPRDVMIPAWSRRLIFVDLTVRLPDGCYGRVAPRSGLSLQKNLDVGAGVVDPDYKGNLGVLLINSSSVDYAVRRGDKIAQLVCEKYANVEIVEIINDDSTIAAEKNLTAAERNTNGFGSSG